MAAKKKAAKKAKKKQQADKGNEQPRGRGAPSIKTEDLLNAICESISSGISTRQTAINLGIAQKSVWTWLEKDASFAQRYARAKEECADLYAEEIAEISDELPDGTLDPQVFNARQRLRVDARKWTASKLKPKKYGDKIDTTVSGPDGGPVKIERIERVIVDPKK